MRSLALLAVLFVPAVAVAQSPGVADKTETMLFVLKLYDKESGGFKVEPKGKPSLRAVNGAAKAVKYLGDRLPDAVQAKAAAFVLTCYDPATGAFAEPGGKPDVAITSIGVMAAVELGIPEGKYPKAVEYLKANARTFEEVRIGAAALEALQTKPDWVGDWFKIADAQIKDDGTAGDGDGMARETASVVAMKLRLGFPGRELVNSNKLDVVLQAGQRADGGYGKAKATGSDLESTYRVMRAFVLMKERPKERRAMREFIARCRNKDGGYGVAPGEPSTMSGTYYASIISKWLDDMEK
jgi:prenyltransferase beta subunit